MNLGLHFFGVVAVAMDKARRRADGLAEDDTEIVAPPRRATRTSVQDVRLRITANAM